MWLITTLAAAVLSTVCWRIFKGRFRLGLLSLMLWGAVLMILTDFILNYDGGPFIQTTTEGLIPSATLLGLAMLVPVIAIWLVMLLVNRKKGN
jgi:hypothetical protein